MRKIAEFKIGKDNFQLKTELDKLARSNYNLIVTLERNGELFSGWREKHTESPIKLLEMAIKVAQKPEWELC